MELNIIKNKHFSKKEERFRKLYEQRYLLMMSVPFVIWLIIFKFIPLWGWTMAFQDYRPNKSFLDQQWVGLKHFITLFQDNEFLLSVRNTLAMSLLSLSFGFVLPIIFALLINEITNKTFKKTVQTISYLPHFISWVIAANIVLTMLSVDNGPVNRLLMALNITDEPIAFMAKPKAFWWIITAADLWKEVGWNSIIYLASITGIDPELYESAEVDGAGRFAKMWHITLASIRPTIVVIFIMNIGWLMSIGFEKQYLLGNAIVQEYAMVVDWYALNYGIGLGRYSYGTAVGIFKSLVSILLIVIANNLADKLGEGRII